LIEETIYLDYPPEALPWAEEEGISTPPQLYDLDTNSLGDPDFYLSTPDNLDFVRGRVRIIGSIPQEDFLSARLQFGKGMNPSSWLQIGEEISTPGNNRWLGYWDTTDLPDGVYAIQLVLIKEDQQINKSSLVVSVDNTPPEIILRSDLAVDIFNFLSGKEIIFEVVFENSSEIEQVDFYLDGELITTRYTEPFITPWLMRLGTHELLIHASDQAGNESELSFEFIVIRD
jgi:hypothetical protein